MKCKDRSYLNRLDNLVDVKKNMYEVVESAVLQIFEEGLMHGAN